MPEVKLAGGFTAKLRTMFKGQPCQTRYGNIGNASYPIAPELRKDLQAALNWLGNEEHKGITWINTDKGEVLFVYPSRIPEIEINYLQMFAQPRNREAEFTTQAECFIKDLLKGRDPGADSHGEMIQLFVLRKIDNGRTKVVYSRQTNITELDIASKAWAEGFSNLPKFPFGRIFIPFPLDVSATLNRVWKQSGEVSINTFKAFSKYHGMELLLEEDLDTERDLHLLLQGAVAVSASLGRYQKEGYKNEIWPKLKNMLGMMGFLLYRKNIMKEEYMEEFPFLYGQLLKISDSLHELYCMVVRNGDLPSQLVGSSLFQSAAETPLRTLSALAQRMNPYITWAKTYRFKNITEKGAESWKAGWLLSLYETIATELYAAWTNEVHFNDVEKAQLFIGFLAAFSKRAQDDQEQ